MIYFFTFSIFLLTTFFLAIGLIVAKKRLKGSCGGAQILGPDGEPLSCSTCPNRDKEPNCKNK